MAISTETEGKFIKAEFVYTGWLHPELPSYAVRLSFQITGDSEQAGETGSPFNYV